jgi:hypothetical protein
LLALDFDAAATEEAEAFWNAATAEGQQPDNDQAMSLEEARRLGLISFDADEDAP